MKQLFVLSLALILTFGLLACGNAENDTGLEDADGNAEIEVDTPTDPTITDPAENDPELCQHSWVDATCSAPKTCTLCKATEGEPSAESHAMSGWQLYIDGQGYAPDENRNSCTVCGIYESKLNFDRMMFRYADLANAFGYFEKGQLPEVADVITAAFWGGIPCESTDVDFVYYHTIKIADLDDFTRKCLGTTYDYTQIQNLPVLWESICNYDAEKNAIVIRSLPAGGGDGFMRDQVTWTTEDDIHYTVTVKYVSYEVEGAEYTQVFTMEKVENNYIITSVGDPS